MCVYVLCEIMSHTFCQKFKFVVMSFLNNDPVKMNKEITLAEIGKNYFRFLNKKKTNNTYISYLVLIQNPLVRDECILASYIYTARNLQV